MEDTKNIKSENLDEVKQDKIVNGYYSNIAQMEVSLFDFKILFGIKSDVTKEGFNPRDVSNVVIMSPQHAKALSKMLNDNIKKYEENFGPINSGTISHE